MKLPNEICRGGGGGGTIGVDIWLQSPYEGQLI